MIEDQSKEQTIRRNDINIGIESTKLAVILKYAYEINGNIIFQFYKDKILIQLSDSSNTQFTEYLQLYTELTINSGQLLHYDPGIDDDNGIKILGIEVEGILNKINVQLEKESVTIIKIDSIKERKAEFDLPSGVKIFSKIFDVSEREINVLKAARANIEKMRYDTQIEYASAIIEPLSFNKISTFNGKGKVCGVENRILLTLDQEGLHVTTGDFHRFTLFELSANEDTNSDSTKSDFLTQSDVEKSRLELENYIIGSNSQNINKEPSTELLNKLKVSNPQSVLVEIDYIKPFVLLNAIDRRPILIEIRQDKPLILQKVGSEEIEKEFLNDALLVITPRKREILQNITESPNIDKQKPLG